MVYNIAEIIKTCIADASLSYVDVLAGLVQTETVKKPVDKIKLVAKTYPVYCPLKGDCSPNNIVSLVPNPEYKSLFYFENNGGVTPINNTYGYCNYTAKLMLVGWLNPKKLGSSECVITDGIIAEIIKVLRKPRFNSGMVSKIKINPTRLLTKERRIFDKYKYRNAHHLLEFPYDYFAIEMDVDFSIHRECIDKFIASTPLPC